MERADALRRRLEADFSDLLGQDFPRFSDAEMRRRRRLVEDLCAAEGLDAAVSVQTMRGGTQSSWLTGWPATQEAVTVIAPGRPPRLYVQHRNHVPLARRIASGTEVAWGEASGLAKALEALRAGRPLRVGLIGAVTLPQHRMLLEAADRIVDLGPHYARLRLVKSAEEVRWLRLGAAFTDLAMAALAEGARPGIDERQLGALVEAPYVPLGAVNAIHYFLATPMSDPSVAVPMQFPSGRALAKGDALVAEISAQFWDYSGQVLRTFVVGEEPNALYRDLHAVADAAFDAVVARIRPGAHAGELVEASALIEAAGFTIIDDLVHGYGGGYLPPVLGSTSRPAAGGVPDMRLQAGMALVVQPNVVTPDRRAGVQTGHLVLVTEMGAEPLQRFPRGLTVLPA
jgi:Xaa-Pro dipeptidase